MSAYTTRPFTEDERSYVEFTVSYLQGFKKLLPMLMAWRLFFCICVSTTLSLFLVLGIFGQSRLTVGIALLLGLTLGNGVHQAWNRAIRRREQEWEAQWAGQREQWEQIREGGVMETLTTPVSEYVLVGTEGAPEQDGVCFIPVSESETLCLFAAELDTESADGFPGKNLTITRFPITGAVYQVACRGKSPAPLCVLNWSDFAGFASADSFFSWLVHGRVYPISLDQLEQGLISVE